MSLNPSSPPRSIATPCVKVCVVDGATSLCLGCWRTLSEIGGWSGFTDEERARIMAELPAREASGEWRVASGEWLVAGDGGGWRRGRTVQAGG